MIRYSYLTGKGSEPLKFRHEYKHEISYGDLLILRQRLGTLLQRDPHAVGGSYQIRSLYFDTPGDTALREKQEGLSRREKFRLRYYNADTSFIRLEKKSKLGSLCCKETAPITREQVIRLLAGEEQDTGEPLLDQLQSRIRTTLLSPKTVVEYTREPFLYPPGNVRVTLDYDIRSGLDCREFLNPRSLTVPTPDNPILLEVKWDEFLPDLIRDAIQLENRHTGAFSKYAQCRRYG